jgi:uncharacterized protein YgiM (DUF1202 family)
MIKPSALVEKFQYALKNKWGYIANKAGSLWTAQLQAAATDETIKKYGSKWIGHYVSDCSGMFAWAFKQLGGYMYHGSNTMYRKYCVETGEIKSPPPVGAAVFKRRPGTKYADGWDYYHVGLYVGDGKVIEAKGTQSGVVQTSLSTWGFYGLLKGVDYGAKENQNEVDPVVGTGKAVVDVPNDTSVNVRRKPSRSSTVALQLPEGTEVNVVENDGTWCKVEYKNVGYVMSKYLKETEANVG